MPHLESSLLDISDNRREGELCGHSEKLAIAYALCKTFEGTTIRIVKNLWVCEDINSLHIKSRKTHYHLPGMQVASMSSRMENVRVGTAMLGHGWTVSFMNSAFPGFW